MRIHLFGGLAVRNGVEVSAFPTRRASLILARTALAHQASVSRDELADELWPEEYLDATRPRLRQELKRIRATLGEAKGILVTDKIWVRLDLESVSVDTREFERWANLALVESDEARRADLCRRAIDLYEGPLLPEHGEHWVFAARLELREKFVRAARVLLEFLARKGEDEEAVRLANRLLRVEPTQGDFLRASVEGHLRLGEVGEAGRLLQNYVQSSGAGLTDTTFRELDQMVRSIKVETHSGALPTPDFESTTEESLPDYLDEFFGREEEIRLLTELIDPSSRARIVTLVGPGGVGKTRLAVESVRKSGLRAVFVRLDDMEPEALEERCKGLREDGEPWVLVLDNAESMPELAGRMASLVVSQGPFVKVLATSRQSLGVKGERLVPIMPLSPLRAGLTLDELRAEPVARLFIDRAQSHDPSFEISDGDAPFVLALIERLDGLPLAVELAASRAGSLGIREVLNRIDDRFTFLVTKRTDLPERQRSLWAAVDWSYRGLSEDLQRTLRGLATFRGGWTLELGRRFLGDGLAESLETLRDRSLVAVTRTEFGTRYRLMDTVREFVRSECPEEELHDWSRRFVGAMVSWTESLGQRWYDNHQADTYREFHLEYENIVAALHWAEKHDHSAAFQLTGPNWRYWAYHGHTRDGQRLFSRVLGRCGVGSSDAYGRTLFGMGYLCYVLNEFEAAEPWFGSAVAFFEKRGSARLAEWCRMNQAGTLLALGRWADAYSLISQVVETLGKLEPGQPNYPLAMAVKAEAAAAMGQFEEAKSLMEESMALRVAYGDRLEIGRCYRETALVLRQCGEEASRLPLLTKAYELLKEDRMHTFYVWTVLELAELAVDDGRPGDAESLLTMAESALRAFGSLAASAHWNRIGTTLALMEGDFLRGMTQARVAIEDSMRLGDPYWFIRDALMTFDLLVSLNRVEEAQAVLGELLGVVQVTGRILTPWEFREIVRRSPRVEPVKTDRGWLAFGSWLLGQILVPGGDLSR